MTDWFDPQSWLRRIPDPLNVRGLIADSASAGYTELASLAEGRPIDIARGQNRIRGTIESVRVRATGQPAALSLEPAIETLERVEIGLASVDWNGVAIGRSQIVVDDVTVAPLPKARISGGPVALELELPVESLSAWLTGHDISVVAVDAEAGTVQIRYRWWRMPLLATVVPGVTARTAVLRISSLRCMGRRVPLPKRFDVSLSVSLPVPENLRLLDVRVVDDSTLAVMSHVPEFSQPISLRRVLERLRGSAAGEVLEISDDD